VKYIILNNQVIGEIVIYGLIISPDPLYLLGNDIDSIIIDLNHDVEILDNNLELTSDNGGTIYIVGSLIINGDLIVTGNNWEIIVADDAYLNVTGDVIFDSPSGSDQTTPNLIIDGDVEVDGDITGVGNIEGDGDLDVGGEIGDDVTISDGIALPITLVFFEAEYINGIVYLNWATASEINNSHIELLKSYNGKNWEVIKNFQGYGTTNYLKHYKYIDNESSSNNIIYYRLKQYDYDGKYTYHNIIYVIKNDMEIRIWRDTNNINIYIDDFKDKSIIIFTVYGRKLFFSEIRKNNISIPHNNNICIINIYLNEIIIKSKIQ